MSDSFVTLYQQVLYLFSHITLIDVLGHCFWLQVCFSSPSRCYTRHEHCNVAGVIMIAVLGGALLVLLPLDTLSRLVTIILIAGVIAMQSYFKMSCGAS